MSAAIARRWALIGLVAAVAVVVFLNAAPSTDPRPGRAPGEPPEAEDERFVGAQGSAPRLARPDRARDPPRASAPDSAGLLRVRVDRQEPSGDLLTSLTVVRLSEGTLEHQRFDASRELVLRLPSGAYRLLAHSERWTYVPVHVDVRPRDDRVVLLRATRKRVLRVVVRTSDGQPAADAHVVVVSGRADGFGSGEPAPHPQPEGCVQRTDHDGRADLCHPPSLPAALVVAWSSGFDEAGSAWVRAGAVEQVVQLSSERSALVRLVGGDARSPVAGTVGVIANHIRVGALEVGAAGRRVAHPGLVGAVLLFLTGRSDGAVASWTRFDAGERSVDLQVGGTEVALTLEVVDPNDVRVAGVHAVASPLGPLGESLAVSGRTGEDGRVRLVLPRRDGPGGTSYCLTLGREGFAAVSFPWMPAGQAREHTLRHVLAPAARLTIRVTDPWGSPVEGAHAHIAPWRSHRSSTDRLSRVARLRSPAQTDRDGVVSWHDLHPGKAVDVVVLHPTLGWGWISLAPRAEGARPEDVILRPLQELRVEVWSAEGPVGGALVEVDAPGVPWGPGRLALRDAASVRTDAAGGAVVLVPAATDVSLTVQHPGYHTARAHAGGGSGVVRVRLRPEVAIAGRVIPMDPELTGCMLEAVELPSGGGEPGADSVPRRATATVSRTGAFRFLGLRAGAAYRIRALPCERAVVTVVVPPVAVPREDLELKVEVQAGTPVRIDLEEEVPPEAWRLVAVRLHHWDAEGQPATLNRSVWVTGAGSKVLLPAVEGILELVTPGAWPHVEAIDLRDRRPRAVAVRAASRWAIVEVRDARGRPVKDAEVMVRGLPHLRVPGEPGGGRTERAIWRGCSAGGTDHQGIARVPLPASGEWDATIRIDATSGEVRIDSGSAVDERGHIVVRVDREVYRGPR